MDGIASVGTTSSYVPLAAAASAGQAPQPGASDTVTLSSGDSSAATNTYAPDAGFISLLQSDPGLAQDYAADNQFGYHNDVVATDDTLSAAAPVPTPTQTSVAEKVDVSALNFSGGLMSALLGGASDSFFSAAGMSSLLTANGSAALAYLTPQAAAAGGSLNVSA